MEFVRHAMLQTVSTPYPVIFRKWLEVAECLEVTLSDLSAFKAVPTDGEVDLAKSWGNFLYKVAEFIEALEKHVIKPLNLDVKVSRSLDRLLSEQCNILKHNGARIGIVEASDGLITIYGYQLQHLKKGVLEPFESVHKNRPSISFNLEARRMYLAVLYAGMILGDAVTAKFGGALEREAPLPSELFLREKVMSLPLFVFPGEKNVDVPVIQAGGRGREAIELSGGGSVPLVNVNLRLGAMFMFDGFTSNFGMPRV